VTSAPSWELSSAAGPGAHAHRLGRLEDHAGAGDRGHVQGRAAACACACRVVSWVVTRARAASPSPAFCAVPGLRIPRYVPSYEAVDAMFEPILDDARALEAHSARRVVELEAELAKVDAELVRAPGPPAAQGF